MKTTTLILLFLVFEPRIFAKEYKNPFYTTKSLGYGGAGLTKDSGLDAFFSNPSLLTKEFKNRSEVQLLSPQLTLSKHAIELYEKRDQFSSADISINTIISDWDQKNIHIHTQSLSGLNYDNFSFALIAKSHANFEIEIYNKDILSGKFSELVHIENVSRYGTLVGYSTSVFDDFWVGISSKFLMKSQFIPKVSEKTLVDLIKTKNKGNLKTYFKEQRGFGINFDSGITWAPYLALNPRIGLVIQDILPTFYLYKKNEAPSKETTYINLGTSLSDRIFDDFEWSVSIDFFDLFNKSKQSIYKKIFIGTQLEAYEIFGLLIGLHQGYPSYGFYFGFDYLKMEFATYTQERDKFLGEEPNIRYSFRFKAGWDL